MNSTMMTLSATTTARIMLIFCIQYKSSKATYNLLFTTYDPVTATMILDHIRTRFLGGGATCTRERLICEYIWQYNISEIHVVCRCQALLSYDRPQDLYQAVGMLYSLFHLDIDNLTLSLLNVTLASLLLQSFPASTPSQSFNLVGDQPAGLSSTKFLTDPRGGALAKLCVLSINLMCAARRFTSTGRSELLCSVEIC